MGSTTAGICFLASLIVALIAVHVPLGDYMFRVYTNTRDSRAERFIYRIIGADPRAEQNWGAYARSVLAFSAVSVLGLFFFQLVQGRLPLHLDEPATAITPALAWNTAVSFVTNTNWQAYSGETTQGHLVQMAGLAVQNFVSAAVGMAVAIALVRGFARRDTRSPTIGGSGRRPHRHAHVHGPRAEQHRLPPRRAAVRHLQPRRHRLRAHDALPALRAAAGGGTL